MSRRGRQTGLNQALDQLAGRLNKRSGGAYLQSRVFTAWARVAGERVAAHTTGTHLREGEMVVYVDSPTWSTELTALSEMYRQAVNKEIGEEAVKTVRFAVSKRVSRQRAEETKERQDEDSYREDKVKSVPLTAQEREQVEESVAAIEDEELRQAVLRATVADLEWKKGIAQHKSR